MGKPINGKQLLQDAKDKVKSNQKQTKQNEKETNTMNKKHTIITITLTLLTLAALGASFFYGMQFGISQEQAVNSRVVTEAKSLVTIAETKK